MLITELKKVLQKKNEKPQLKKRCFGSAKGKFVYPEDFDEDNEEIDHLFYKNKQEK